jgi:hypothetical protein
MGNTAGDFYNPTIAVAARSLTIEPEQSRVQFVDRLLNHKDKVDKEDVLNHLDNFSCREEIERYVEQQEQG